MRILYLYYMPDRKVRVNVEIPLSKKKILKILGAELGLTMTTIANEAFLTYIQNCLENDDLPPNIKAQVKAYLRK